jgi:hypothetical protein
MSFENVFLKGKREDHTRSPLSFFMKEATMDMIHLNRKSIGFSILTLLFLWGGPYLKQLINIPEWAGVSALLTWLMPTGVCFAKAIQELFD